MQAEDKLSLHSLLLHIGIKLFFYEIKIIHNLQVND